MNCSGSIALIGDESSIAGADAMMGTAAHKVIETMLIRGETDASLYHNRVILVHGPGAEETVILEPGAAAPIIPDWYMFVCDDKMVAGVQMHIDEVERVRAELFDPELHTERFLDMTWLDDRLGGTADTTAVEPGGWIHLFDYKNGRVIVEVTDNEQMKNYAVGLLHEHPDAAGVVVHLIQPNAIHEDGCIREATYTADELKLFEITLKQAADATSKPNAPRRAGDWCTYCPAKLRCPEFDALVQNEAGADFSDDPIDVGALETPLLIDEAVAATSMETELYTDEDQYHEALVRKARWIPLLDQWARDVRGKIQSELVNGKKVGDWKLVRGKANRVWHPDETTARAVLNGKWSIPNELLFAEPKLRSPAQIEKITTPGKDRKTMKTIVATLARKGEGKITVAPGNDPRPAIDPAAIAAADFADDPAEDFEP
jgi:hypothetical protein